MHNREFAERVLGLMFEQINKEIEPFLRKAQDLNDLVQKTKPESQEERDRLFKALSQEIQFDPKQWREFLTKTDFLFSSILHAQKSMDKTNLN